MSASILRRLSSRTVYENRWMRVREDAIERPDGSRGIYGVVEKPDFVVIIPVEGDLLHLVEQYRYPVQTRQWEFPQGSWEHAPDADPLAVAKAELREETGLEARTVTRLGHLHSAYGYSTQGCHVFLATSLVRVGREEIPEEQDLVTRAVARRELEAMILAGEIKDATTVAAYGLLCLHERRG
jgi:ADP-ribose pyrophosphatase